MLVDRGCALRAAPLGLGPAFHPGAQAALGEGSERSQEAVHLREDLLEEADVLAVVLAQRPVADLQVAEGDHALAEEDLEFAIVGAGEGLAHLRHEQVAGRVLVSAQRVVEQTPPVAERDRPAEEPAGQPLEVLALRPLRVLPEL